MELALRERTALIAGSSAGIGLAIARAFRQEGTSVLITGRNPERLAAAKESLLGDVPAYGEATVESFAGDMSDGAAVQACVAHARAVWGRLDVAVANVGTGKMRPEWDAGPEVWDLALRQNVLSAVTLVRAAVPLIEASGGGAVVLVGSIAGIEDMRSPVAYAAAKAALHAFGKGLARQLAGQRIRVNVVAPGNVRFPGGRWDELERANPDATQRYIRDEVPLQRFGGPEEVASVVVFLASGAASFMTGACVVVDGGQTRSL
jgi:3-oxoacyl-[acyl-carrier protein] reductase